jgi:hypothetical protein
LGLLRIWLLLGSVRRSSRLGAPEIARERGCQTEFSKVLLGERSLRILYRLEVLRLDFLVDFAAVDGDAFWGIDADTDYFSIYALDQKDDVVANLDRFANFS